jgi:membrane protein DedA with SNARE-associated domain
LISNTTLFTLAYIFGKNYQFLLSGVKFVNVIIFLTFAFALIIFIWYKRKKPLKNTK